MLNAELYMLNTVPAITAYLFMLRKTVFVFSIFNNAQYAY